MTKPARNLRPAPEPAVDIPSAADRESEYATIGALLIAGPATQAEILDAVADADYLSVQCQFLSSTARLMRADGVPVDAVTIAGFVASRGLLGPGAPRMNLSTFTHQMTDHAPVASSGTCYAAAVVEAAVRRCVSSAATRIVDAASAASVDDLAEVIESEFSSIRDALRRVTK